MSQDQIAKWKAAIASHNKGKRRDRWKRPGKPVTGLIRYPPLPPADKPSTEGKRP